MKIERYSSAFWMWLLPQTNLIYEDGEKMYRAFIWIFWIFKTRKEVFPVKE